MTLIKARKFKLGEVKCETGIFPPIEIVIYTCDKCGGMVFDNHKTILEFDDRPSITLVNEA
jgi:hypothetical protein